MGLGVRYLCGRSHETERQSARSVNELFRNEGAEESDRHTILRKRGSNVTITAGGYVFDLFSDFIEGGLIGHSIADNPLHQIIFHMASGEIQR